MVIFMDDSENKHTKKGNRILNSKALQLKSIKSFIYTLHTTKKSDKFFSLNSFKQEEFEAAYVTMVKSLLRNADFKVLEDFYDAIKNNSRILKPLLHCSHCTDIMLRNAARIGLLIVLKKCTDDAKECIYSAVLPQHVRDIILYLKKTAIYIQFNFNLCEKNRIENLFHCYEEELEYIDDILNINAEIKIAVISTLFNDYIIPFLVSAIVSTKIQTSISSPIFFRTSLSLLTLWLENVTDNTMKTTMTHLLVPHEKNQVYDKELHQISTIIFDTFQNILESEAQVEIIYILYLLHKVQLHMSGDFDDNLQFFGAYTSILLKLLKYNKETNNDLYVHKLKLLFLILNPLTDMKEFDDIICSQLQEIFSHFLKILYINNCKEFHNLNLIKLISIIDEEYEVFLNSTTTVKFSDIYSTAKANISVRIESLRIALNYLFHVRQLYLRFHKEEDKILPIIKNKVKIGRKMSTYYCVPVKKLVHSSLYESNHYMKLIKNQLLILQGTKNELGSKGIVVFNALYRDVIWLKYSNDTVFIYESVEDQEGDVYSYMKYFIQLKFNSPEELDFFTDFLTRAKRKQTEVINRKLEDLLNTSLT